MRVHGRVLALSLLFVLVNSDPAGAGGDNTLRVCNDGNTTLRVAMARQVLGFFSHGRKLTGWWVIEPETGETIFAFDSSESKNAYFTFLYRDRQNRDGVVLIDRPADHRIYDESNDTFCVSMTNDFQTETDVHTTCPSHYAPPDFQTVTFPLFFMAGALDDSEGANHQTLRVMPDVNRRSEGLLVQWGRPREPSSAPSVALAAPDTKASIPTLPLGTGLVTFASAERVEVVNQLRQGSGWWGLHVPPHTQPTLKASGDSSFVIVTYRVPATSEALWYAPGSFTATIGNTQSVAIRAEGHSSGGTLKVVFQVPRSVSTFSVSYAKDPPVPISIPAPAGASTGLPTRREASAPVRAETRKESLPHWWTSLLGRWSGTVKLAGKQEPVTLEVKASNGGVAAFLRLGQRQPFEVKARIVSGSEEVVSTPDVAVFFTGRLSNGSQRIEGHLDLWVLTMKNEPVTFTKR
jgi:hypothetical protein